LGRGRGGGRRGRRGWGGRISCGRGRGMVRDANTGKDGNLVGLGNLGLGLSENLEIHNDMDGGLGSLMADTIGTQEGERRNRGGRATRGWGHGSQGRGRRSQGQGRGRRD
jgi:hypothetical protein